MSTSLEEEKCVSYPHLFFIQVILKNFQKARCWGNFNPIGTGTVISEHNIFWFVFFKLHEANIDRLTFPSEPRGVK